MTEAATQVPESASTAGPASGLRQWNIAVGGFFFRYRNTVFPVVFILTAFIMRPRVLGNLALDRALRVLGVAVALVGEGVRLLTIGFKYIERGGRGGKVYASRLVQGGVYALTRNPMYLGNGLIALGVIMATGSLIAYTVILPFFLFIYQAIIVAEEDYLARKFGETYVRYCTQVPRIIPAVVRARHALAGLRYDWRSAVRKDLSTIAGLVLGLISLREWRCFWLHGLADAERALPVTLGWASAVLGLYALLSYCKRRRWIFYRDEER